MIFLQLLLCLVFLFPNSSSATYTDSANLPASANVIKPITITKSSDLNFGTFLTGANTITISPSTSLNGFNISRTATDSSKVIGNTFSGAYFIINKEIAQNPTVSISSPITLYNAENSSKTLTASNITYVSPDSLIDTSYRVLIGGTLTIPSDATEGDYSGTLTITVNY